ncbi:ADP-ribosylglycohydrolase family protein [Pedobacter faecalis]|uniref:ADP-ribosylglycohydrolase family protein n=1 Tax=Pedobacter faecalis TaxID=3041495 RepID=UPI00254F6CEC|nr:ADP-ribosylglycohydrolase family protein [Pedobacter sp. ELA7]
MKKVLLWTFSVLFTCCASALAQKSTFTLSKDKLKDKIKGGWAGQTIGVSFGSYTEFQYNGTFIQDEQTIPWSAGYVKKLMIEWPDLFDDIYMDLTFVDVLERLGFDAPVDSFAHAFATAPYNLWHANQAARYNILNGIKAPQSGHWLNNPHSDDIDYQIEADFAGLMHPGMPNAASKISDRVGHIMNYGDGWYGGVYMGAMYSLAFISSDVDYVVSEGLKTIPRESTFYQCIADVIRWHKKYPSDWKQTWFEVQKKWSSENGCPEGIFAPLNIDAKVNAAYVVMGLLYGKGDFTKTMEIATRTGQDSDCNPSSAAGILGTMIGYINIPQYWKKGLEGAEDMNFKYTSMSLNKVYETSYQHAVKSILLNGGTEAGQNISIAVQKPMVVQLEQGFAGLYPVEKRTLHTTMGVTYEFDFEGTGFVLRGAANKNRNDLPDFTYEANVYIDGQLMETAHLSTAFHLRRHDITWRYQLPKGKHHVKIELVKHHGDYHIRLWDCLIFSDKPADGIHKHVDK